MFGGFKKIDVFTRDLFLQQIFNFILSEPDQRSPARAVAQQQAAARHRATPPAALSGLTLRLLQLPWQLSPACPAATAATRRTSWKTCYLQKDTLVRC